MFSLRLVSSALSDPHLWIPVNNYSRIQRTTFQSRWQHDKQKRRRRAWKGSTAFRRIGSNGSWDWVMRNQNNCPFTWSGLWPINRAWCHNIPYGFVLRVSTRRSNLYPLPFFLCFKGEVGEHLGVGLKRNILRGLIKTNSRFPIDFPSGRLYLYTSI